MLPFKLWTKQIMSVQNPLFDKRQLNEQMNFKIEKDSGPCLQPGSINVF